MRKLLVVMVVSLVLLVVASPPAAQAQGDAGADLEAKYGVCNDPVLNDRLQRVGAVVSLGVQQVYPKFHKRLRFKLLNDEDLNAMALVDGRVYVTSGMMESLSDRPDDEPASVLNHEATHVAQGHHRHQAKVGRLTSAVKFVASLFGANGDLQTGIDFGGGLWSAGYSREDEYRADAGGVELNGVDGYDRTAMGRVLETLKTRYGRGMAGVPIIGWFASHPDTGSRIQRVAKLANQPIGTVGGSSPVVASTSATPKRRIEIDADQIRMSGGGSWWLSENLAAMLRNRARGSGVEVAVSGREYADVVATKDRTHNSGEYSQESRSEVPRGQMTSPTVHWSLTGLAEVSYKDRGADGQIAGRHVDYEERTRVALVRLVLEPIDIISGLNETGYESAGTASSTDKDVSVGSWGKYGSYRSDSSRPESILIERAASQAVDRLIGQLAYNLQTAAPAALVPAANSPATSVPPAQMDLESPREFTLYIRPMGAKEGDPRTIQKRIKASYRPIQSADTIMFVTPENVGVAKVAIEGIEGDQVHCILMFPSWMNLKLDGPLTAHFFRE